MNKFIEKIKGYRTFAFNLLMGILIIVGVNDQETLELARQNLENVLTGLAMIWTGGNVILRKITNSPIFKKE